MDRRAVFFVIAGVVCAALIPLAPGDMRWVPTALAGVYALLAAASLADHVSRRREEDWTSRSDQ